MTGLVIENGTATLDGEAVCGQGPEMTLYWVKGELKVGKWDERGQATEIWCLRLDFSLDSNISENEQSEPVLETGDSGTAFAG